MPTMQQRRFRLFILSIGIVTTLCFLIVPGVGRRLLKRDYKEAVPVNGEATVAQIIPARKDADGLVYDPNVLVRFRGSVQRVRSVRESDVPGLTVGQPAAIVYRIGKSGRIYVDSVHAKE